MTTAAASATEATFTEFARIARCKPSFVTQLKAAGRLVLTDDGKRVRVAESLALIADTRDPAKAGVRQRHAANRAHAANSADGAPSSSIDPEGEDAASDALALPADPIEASYGRRRAKAQAEREEAQARKALRDEQLELGELLNAVEVEQAVQHAAATLRNVLENLPNTLAPELAAATDEARVRVILQEAIEHALEETSRQFGALGRAST